jgi:hypothetical protein
VAGLGWPAAGLPRTAGPGRSSPARAGAGRQAATGAARQVRPEREAPGHRVPQRVPPGQAPPGQAPPGQVPPGQVPPGQVPPGQAPPGQAPPGRVPPGQVPPGREPPMRWRTAGQEAVRAAAAQYDPVQPSLAALLDRPAPRFPGLTLPGQPSREPPLLVQPSTLPFRRRARLRHRQAQPAQPPPAFQGRLPSRRAGRARLVACSRRPDNQSASPCPRSSARLRPRPGRHCGLDRNLGRDVNPWPDRQTGRPQPDRQAGRPQPCRNRSSASRCPHPRCFPNPWPAGPRRQ